MRSFAAALLLAILTSAAAFAVAPYRDPVVIKDQSRLEPDVAVPVVPVVVASLHPANAQPKPSVPLKPDTWLLTKAQAYKGTNPTGWRHSWCAKFIAMLAPDLAKKIDNPNWARDWAVLPKAKPKPGVIVVLSRGRGGHIGVLSGFDQRGNPRVVSGNHNRRVAESVYPKRRVLAYVSAQ